MAAQILRLPPRSGLLLRSGLLPGSRLPARAWAVLLLAVLVLTLMIAAVLPLAPLLAGLPAAAGGSARAAQAGGAPSDTAPVIVCLGDSLAAGFGLAPEESFPSLLQEHLRRAGYPQRVVNAGVSGDTSAGGLARLEWVLGQPVQILIVELGANDGLRGQSTVALKHNLSAIVVKGLAAGAQVLLVGMRMPDNYGPDYTRRFAAVYPEVAREYGVPLVPFLLEGVAGKAALNQADGIHPTAAGARIVAATVWKGLKPLLDGPRR